MVSRNGVERPLATGGPHPSPSDCCNSRALVQSVLCPVTLKNLTYRLGYSLPPCSCDGELEASREAPEDAMAPKAPAKRLLRSCGCSMGEDAADAGREVP